jgi:isoleucyl-tRNA synthetase
MEGKMGNGTLRSTALDEIKKVHWDPAWGEERISNMIATRPDWCISRQRIWGVPIAVFFCEECDEVLDSPEVKKLIIELFRREGADAWYKKSASEILPSGTKCPKCEGARFRKEMDIIDVWFESGSSQAAVLGHEPNLPWPADLYLEGGDQHRGWFHSSLLCGIGLHGAAPYRAVTTAGWTLDDKGRAQSKSLGNTVDPVDIAKRFGGEIVRLWVSSVDFREDVVGTEALMERISGNYIKIRNTFRYILGNLNEFNPERDAIPFDEMEPLDRYMLTRTEEFAREVRQWYHEMMFHRVYHRLNQFCVVDLSSIYFYVLKDRLYTKAPKSRERRSAQTAIWRIGEALVRLVAPIMTFTADEIWQYLPQVGGREESVHLALFPKPGEITGEVKDQAALDQLVSDWHKMFEVREEVLKGLEAVRQNKTINDALEAKVTVTAPKEVAELLQRYRKNLNEFFVVSVTEIKEGPELSVQAEHAPGEKCERCWNYSLHVGEDKNYPTVCERCSATLAEIERG